MATAHINIGSNIGDRKATISLAVAAIEHEFNRTATCSDLIESDPWGYDSSNRFLNLGINIDIGTRLPEDVLQILQKVQSDIDPSDHRDCSGNYIDRRIDIDIIAIDNIVLSAPQLKLPHPRMHLREFVLKPMAQIWPDWIHPLLQKRPQELIDHL